MKAACPGLLCFVIACGSATPPPATHAVPIEAPPPPDGRQPDIATPAPAATSSADVSVGYPTTSGAATSACDGKPGANLATGGTATASGGAQARPDEGPALAFDDHTGTKWVESTNPHPWLAYEFGGGQAHVVTQYALGATAAGNAGTDPVNWKFEGANDAAGPWVTLDTRSQDRFVSRQALVWYSIRNTTPYRRYRLVVTKNGGGRGVELAELQLFGPGTPTFSVDDAVAGADRYQFQYSAHWEGFTRKDIEFVPAKYGLSSSWSKRKDETLTIAFEGSQITLYGIRYPSHGIAAVSIDDGPEVMADLFGAPQGDYLLYTSPSLCPRRPHVLRVRVTGDKHPQSGDSYISLDRVKIVP
jgi:hypothetical protein